MSSCIRALPGPTRTACSSSRYSKQAKDWGWREFLTLTTLFDVDAGFLVNDAVQFTAEVLVLKESYTILEVIPSPVASSVDSAPGPDASADAAPGSHQAPQCRREPRELRSPAPCSLPTLLLQASERPVSAKGGLPTSLPAAAPVTSITWNVDNLSAFKDILETRKLFSRSAGGKCARCPGALAQRASTRARMPRRWCTLPRAHDQGAVTDGGQLRWGLAP